MASLLSFSPKQAKARRLPIKFIELFKEDQALLTDTGIAKKNPAFEQTYKSYVKRVVVEDHPNFYDPAVYDPAVYELWAQMPDAPEVVRRYATFRKATDAHIGSIVADNGWPQRAS